MTPPRRFSAILTAILLFSGAAGHAAAPLPGDERELWNHANFFQGGKVKSAEVKADPETRVLTIVAENPDSGMSTRCLLSGKRFNPIPYLNDPAPSVELTLCGDEKTLPEGFYAVVETLDQTQSPAVRKTVKTATEAAATATPLPEGWKVLRLPFDAAASGSACLTAGDVIERIQILAATPGTFQLRKIAFVRSRNVSAELKNPPSQNLERLEIEGRTADPSAKVTLKLVDAAGRASTKTAQAEGGAYRLVWERPPLTPGKTNLLHAAVGGGKNPLDQAVPREIFGYATDTSHVWLKVKGRDIVTSPKSKGGERPFYAVGVGYAKSVIVRGYDEEVAAYAKAMGLNTLRLAFYTTHFNNKADRPLSFGDITAFIDPVVAAAKRHGLYVILDDHSYFKNEIDEENARGEQKSAGWTEERFHAWIDRWAQVAAHYKDEPYILGYELCNEPVCTPETARKWYTRCIDAVRKADARHIILVGSNAWSHSRTLDVTWNGIANGIDAPRGNVVFAFHDYPQDDNPWVVQSALRAFQAKYNVPVMCTEFGGGGKPEPIHREFQAGMLSLFAHDRIGWMLWTLVYDNARAVGYPSKAIRVEGEQAADKAWKIQNTNPGYWIPYVELWAPAARMMGTAFPEPAAGKE